MTKKIRLIAFISFICLFFSNQAQKTSKSQDKNKTLGAKENKLPSLLNETIAQYQEKDFFCISESPSATWENEFQTLIKNYTYHKTSQNEYLVPVIFHVIHGGEAVGTFPNITSGQINSQIVVLNQDYSGTGLNSNNYPLNAFVNWASNQSIPAQNLDSSGRIKIASASIVFCLAEKDTNGNMLTEPGIERINYLGKGWQNPSILNTNQDLRAYLDTVIKPQSIWDVTKYLNVWITDKNSAISAKGFGTPPPLSGLAGSPNTTTNLTDGVWCYTKSLGSSDIYPLGIFLNNDVKGRLLTHEIGHWLGLRHIWGDGNCLTDYCNDTPSQYDPSAGTPTYPQNPGSCNNPSNFPDGEMFMNFMDYTANQSMYMFTTDQVTRMYTALENSPHRNQLGTHNLCNTLLSISDNLKLNDLKIYPNPTFDLITVEDNEHVIAKIDVFNILGQNIIKTNANNFSLSPYEAGVYIVKVLFKSNETKSLKIIKK